MDCENVFNFMLLQGQKGHEKDQEKDAYKRNWKCKVEFWFAWKFFNCEMGEVWGTTVDWWLNFFQASIQNRFNWLAVGELLIVEQ